MNIPLEAHDSRQEFADWLMKQGFYGRRIIGMACLIHLDCIEEKAVRCFVGIALAKFGEQVAEFQAKAKDELLRDRSVIEPIAKLRSECPPHTQTEITQDVASFFKVPLKQAEAILYIPSAPETRQQRYIPAPRRLGGDQ